MHIRVLAFWKAGIIMRSMAFFSLFLAASFAFSQAAALGPASDFNGDGRSDPVLVTINSDKSLSWTAVLDSAGQALSLGTFGTAGEHLIMADWIGMGTPQPGSASLTSRGIIRWRIRTQDNRELSRDFGSRGNIVVSGADFNHNGVADAALVTLERSAVVWRIWLDPFAAAGVGAQSKISFGKKGDVFFYADPDGNGDWLAVLRRDAAGNEVIMLKNPLSGEERSVAGIPAYVSMTARPLPLRQKGGADVLAFAVPDGSRTKLYLQKPDGSAPELTAIRASGEMIAGDFNASGSDEIAFQISTGFLIYNPSDGSTVKITAPAGIAVDEININRLGGSADDWVDDTAGDIPASGPLADVCANFRMLKFPEMLIKSESSGHINTADPRKSGYTVLCGTVCPKNLRKADIFYSDGSYAASVGKYNNWIATNKPRLYGATAGAPAHSAARIARVARTKGNGKIYLQTSRARRGAATLCREFNPSGRNGGVKTSYGVAR